MSTEAARMIGAAIAVVSLFGIGLGMSNLFSAWINAVTRNPEAEEKVRLMGMLGFALTESIALFALIIAVLILFK